MVTTASVNPSEILIAKSMFHEQLHSLTQRFNNLAADDNCDYDETNVKFADAATNLKYISLLKNIEELVSSKRILILLLFLLNGSQSFLTIFFLD